MTEREPPDDEYEDTSPQFERIATKVHQDTVAMIIGFSRTGSMQAVVTGLVAGIVESLWRLRREGMTTDSLRKVLANMVDDFIVQIDEEEIGTKTN